MDKVPRPEKFCTDPSSVGASKSWILWRRTFENHLAVLVKEGFDKFGALTNLIWPTVLEYLEECAHYESAIANLHNIYVKPANEIYARHQLATRRQQAGESPDEYLQALKIHTKECNLKPVTATEYCKEYIRDAFIFGIHSNQIRQKLLEDKTLDLKTMFDQSRALNSAMRSSESYSTPQSVTTAATASKIIYRNQVDSQVLNTLVLSVRLKCPSF